VTARAGGASSSLIGLDEANFTGPTLVDAAQRLADSGRQVIIAGLDTDYLRRPFPPVPGLLALAETITNTIAFYKGSGNPARHTDRRRGSGSLIEVGATAGQSQTRAPKKHPKTPKNTPAPFSCQVFL